LFYVAQTLHDFLPGVLSQGEEGRARGRAEATISRLRVADVGAGEGLLLGYLRETLGAQCDLWGIEPSERNCASLKKSGFTAINGTLQSAINLEPALKLSFDLVTLTWTLENTNNPNEVIAGARDLLTDGGHLLVATGSKILVPFKKLLDEYLTARAADTQAVRWSRKSLGNLLAKHGFAIAFENRWQDSDWMVLIAKKVDKPSGDLWLERDDPQAVIDFFSRWAETSDWLTKQFELETHRSN
jgi:SAM-dependent methyltransferase